jgi:hypothetical protein
MSKSSNDKQIVSAKESKRPPSMSLRGTSVFFESEDMQQIEPRSELSTSKARIKNVSLKPATKKPRSTKSRLGKVATSPEVQSESKRLISPPRITEGVVLEAETAEEPSVKLSGSTLRNQLQTPVLDPKEGEPCSTSPVALGVGIGLFDSNEDMNAYPYPLQENTSDLYDKEGSPMDKEMDGEGSSTIKLSASGREEARSASCDSFSSYSGRSVSGSPRSQVSEGEEREKEQKAWVKESRNPLPQVYNDMVLPLQRRHPVVSRINHPPADQCGYVKPRNDIPERMYGPWSLSRKTKMLRYCFYLNANSPPHFREFVLEVAANYWDVDLLAFGDGRQMQSGVYWPSPENRGLYFYVNYTPGMSLEPGNLPATIRSIPAPISYPYFRPIPISQLFAAFHWGEALNEDIQYDRDVILKGGEVVRPSQAPPLIHNRPAERSGGDLIINPPEPSPQRASQPVIETPELPANEATSRMAPDPKPKAQKLPPSRRKPGFGPRGPSDTFHKEPERRTREGRIQHTTTTITRPNGDPHHITPGGLRAPHMEGSITHTTTGGIPVSPRGASIEGKVPLKRTECWRK